MPRPIIYTKSYPISSEDEDREDWDMDKWPEPVPEKYNEGKQQSQQKEPDRETTCTQPGEPGAPARMTVLCLCCKNPIGDKRTKENKAYCLRCHEAIFESEQNFQKSMTMTWKEYIESLKYAKSDTEK